MVVVLALAAVATVVVLRSGFGSPSCASPTVVHVAAAPAVAPVVSRVAAALPGQDCTRFEVRERESAAVAESLAVSDGAARPQVWIPESGLRLQWAGAGGITDVPNSGTSVASSPVVLALAQDAAGDLGWPGRAPTWSAALAKADLTLGMPDPARDPVGVAGLLGVRAVTGGAADSAAFTSALRRVSPNTTASSADLFSRLPGSTAPQKPVSAFPSSENAVLRRNSKQGERPLVAVYPEAPVPALDFPYTVLTSSNQAQGAAAADLLHALLAPAGASALSDAGFRAPDGHFLRDRSADTRISAADRAPVAMPPSSTVDDLLNVWAGVNLSSRVRVLIDVSGSMNAVIPGTGRTRMDVTLEAAEKGMRLFKPTSKIGIWTFSTELDGDKDYREIIPMAPVSEQLAGSALAKLRAVKATAQGRTGLYDSTLAAYRQARAEWEPGRLNVVAVMTDGRNEDPHGISRAELLAQLGKLADPRRPVQIIGIGVGPDVDAAELDAITTPTGGKAFTTKDPAKISDVFYGALGKLSCQPPGCG
ncbi:substrate-binding domain-containing protein [Amycolatopsis minnesotensis]|uniref:Substrate-binding domain-containing protein n=1 Tax=Amycolatopsis minnesotensis TaxID=337894 RepID=A0ABN2Q3N0_9PSEU